MMKTKFIVLMFSVLLIGGDLFAAGDLVVNGQLGVGANASPMRKVLIESSNKVSGIDLYATQSNGTALKVLEVLAEQTGTGDVIGDTVGINFQTNIKSSGNVSGAQLTPYIARLNFNSAGTHTLNPSLIAGMATSFRVGSGTWNASVPLVNYLSEGIDSGGGTLNLDNNFYHFWVKDSLFGTWGTGEIQAGIWIDKLSRGSVNGGKDMGIVLDGDGAGADIVFGPSQEARIYSNTGRLYAQDSFGNQTILSPHDPETGEWIYYSRNTKTGVVKKVNMEKLVKAVEKLTGDTFMVETLLEDK